MTEPEVGDLAPDSLLQGPDGNDVRLASFWRDRPALVVFLRHWG